MTPNTTAIATHAVAELRANAVCIAEGNKVGRDANPNTAEAAEATNWFNRGYEHFEKSCSIIRTIEDEFERGIVVRALARLQMATHTGNVEAFDKGVQNLRIEGLINALER